MPSFLSDDIDTGPMVMSTFEVPSHVRSSFEKMNGNARASSYMSGKGGLFDTGENQREGEGSVRPVVNKNGRRDESLSSIPNGRSSAGSWENKSSWNGSSASVNGGANGNGMLDNERRSAASQNGLSKHSNVDRGSAASTNGNAQLTPSATTYKTNMNGDSEPPKRVAPPPPISTNPQSTGPLTYTSSLLPPTPHPTETVHRVGPSSPHRFSSPPAYPAPLPPALAQSPTATSSQIGQPILKHRHTLQVPKAGTTRSSREGEDAAYTSGRFSPTAIPASARRGSLSLARRNTQSLHSIMPHEEIPPDEDAMRWAEAVRQKRASKRKRKDEEDDDRVVVGTKVDQNHVNWVTAYNMLTGIRFTVSRTNAKLDRPLTDADFDARHKFSFDITGNELTPSAKYDFKFKDYAPWVFRHLRAKFKLDPADYLMSLTSKYILSELGSPGKSGSFFYFSRDYKYIIKTIHHAEHKFLRKILQDYYSHIEENPNTLLSQFYGLHRVKIPYGRKIHFVVMNNLFPPHRDIHQTFDLKGSTVGRDFKEEDLEKNPRATLKDLNWLRRNLHLEFGPEKKKIFLEQMEKDVHLLQRLKIMDYSMLVGIHDLQKGNQENLRDKTLQVFQPGGDSSKEDIDRGPDGRGMLMRTPSKLESARKARELRQIIKQEKPIPMGQSSSRMPDQIDEKREFIFYSDDGGFGATHEDNSPGDEIFFLSIIDCLTHYGMLKKLEHLWKGLSHDKKLISPVASVPYGDRFINFIEGITKSPEEAAREALPAPTPGSVPHTNTNQTSHSHTTSNDNRNTAPNSFDSSRRAAPMHRTGTSNSVIQRNESDALRRDAREERDAEPRILTTVRSPSAERTGGMQGQTLPVVEEGGEGGSVSGRSGDGSNVGEREDGNAMNAKRPLTPAKDDDVRPRTPAKDYDPANGGVNGNGTQLTPDRGEKAQSVRNRVSRSSLDKELPPLPPEDVPVLQEKAPPREER